MGFKINGIILNLALAISDLSFRALLTVSCGQGWVTLRPMLTWPNVSAKIIYGRCLLASISQNATSKPEWWTAEVNHSWRNEQYKNLRAPALTSSSSLMGDDIPKFTKKLIFRSLKSLLISIMSQRRYCQISTISRLQVEQVNWGLKWYSSRMAIFLSHTFC